MSEDNVFMVDDIRCEVVPINVPEHHYKITAVMEINGKNYGYADIYENSVPIDEGKKRFTKVVLLAKDRAIRKETVNV